MVFKYVTIVYSSHKTHKFRGFLQYKAVRTVSIVFGRVSGVSIVPRNVHGLILQSGTAERSVSRFVKRTAKHG